MAKIKGTGITKKKTSSTVRKTSSVKKNKQTASARKSKKVVVKSKKVARAPVKIKTKSKRKTAAKPLKARKPLAKPKKTAKPVVRKKVPVVSKKKQTKQLSLREQRIQKIKDKLLTQRASLLNEAEVALNELPGQTIFPDLGDQASAETDRSFMLKLRGREQRLLKKIDEALDRIESGAFGICDDCGEEIDIKRLDARPVTTMCIACKTLQEEEEKLREA